MVCKFGDFQNALDDFLSTEPGNDKRFLSDPSQSCTHDNTLKKKNVRNGCLKRDGFVVAKAHFKTMCLFQSSGLLCV